MRVNPYNYVFLQGASVFLSQKPAYVKKLGVLR